MVMRVKYGPYTFPSGECTFARFEWIPHYSERGRRDLNYWRVTLQGQFGGCSESDISTKIDNFLNAFNTNGKELALYDSNGNRTRHYIDGVSSGVVNSPKLIYQSWPEGGRAQYATVRDFVVVMECISIGDEAVLTSYNEVVRNVGISYGWWVPVKTQYGIKFKQVYPTSGQTVIQEGTSVGLTGYYLGPPLYTPVGTTWRERCWEHEENPGAPKLVGDPTGQWPWLYYPSHWRYVFDFSTSTITYPIST